MELRKRKNSYAEFTKYPQTFNCHTWNCKPWRFKTPLAVSKRKKFPWLKQMTSLPLSLNGRQILKILNSAPNHEDRSASCSPLQPTDQGGQPTPSSDTRNWDFKLNVDAAVPRFGLNHLHLPNVPGRVFTGPWGFWGHCLCLKSPG